MMRLPITILLVLVATVPAFAQAPPERTLTPSILRVGKWAEGIASDGKALWVAESGQRSIVQIAGTGTIQRRLTIGRLPVGMAALPDGRVHALVHTDRIVWQQPGTGAGRKLATLADCPQGLAASAQALWALTLSNCSSVDSQAVRIDPTTGAQATTAKLGEWAQAIAVAHGKVWVGHARGERLSIVDPQSLAIERTTVRGAELWALASNRTSLLAGGRIAGTMDQGLIVSIDPRDRAETGRLRVDELIMTLVADDDTLVALGDKGTIWIVATKDFTLRGKINLGVGTYRPSSALIHDGKLVVVAQQYQGENGAVFTLTDWR